MPLHDYLCKNCDRTFELLVTHSTVPACPGCGATQLQKLVSKPIRPGRSAAVIAAGRSRAARAGHTSNYRRSNGKIVD